MGVREARRLGIVEAALRGKLTNQDGALALGLSVRQFRRLKRGVERSGARGVLHGNRGRPSPRRLAGAIRARVEQLLTSEVRLNDCHVRDLLAEQQVRVSADSVRRIRRELGLAPKQRHRPPRHRRRRVREAQCGALVQIDGSPFRWLGLTEPECTLVGEVDDASGAIVGLTLRREEDLHGYFEAVRQMIVTHGVPLALYGDGTSIAVRNDPHWTREEELEGRQRPSHFGLALEALGIRYIRARSPQAKGRIERLWRTLQDRLAAELALQHLTTTAAALAFLPDFITRFNRQLARTPRESAGVWRRAPRDLDHLLACRYPRVVARDNTVSICGTVIDIPPGPHRRSAHGRVVEVRELLDGRLLVLDQDRVLVALAAPAAPFTLVPRSSAQPRYRPRQKSGAPGSIQTLDRDRPRLASRTRRTRRGQLTNIRRPAAAHPWKHIPQPRPQPADQGGT